jgi:hypothetical protein
VDSNPDRLDRGKGHYLGDPPLKLYRKQNGMRLERDDAYLRFEDRQYVFCNGRVNTFRMRVSIGSLATYRR